MMAMAHGGQGVSSLVQIMQVVCWHNMALSTVRATRRVVWKVPRASVASRSQVQMKNVGGWAWAGYYCLHCTNKACAP